MRNRLAKNGAGIQIFFRNNFPPTSKYVFSIKNCRWHPVLRVLSINMSCTRNPVGSRIGTRKVLSVLIIKDQINEKLKTLQKFIAVSSTYINKGSLTYMFIGRKILGGQLSHHVISIEGCLGLQKNLGSRPVNRGNTILERFWWLGAFLLMFYIEKLGKTSKIACFCVLNHINVVFVLIPYPIPWVLMLETF